MADGVGGGQDGGMINAGRPGLPSQRGPEVGDASPGSGVPGGQSQTWQGGGAVWELMPNSGFSPRLGLRSISVTNPEKPSLGRAPTFI